MADPVKGAFQGFDIAAAGLRAEMMRSEIVASNLGNMHRTGNAKNEPYRRKVVVFEELLEQASKGAAGGGSARDTVAGGVAVAKVTEDRSPFPVYHQPGHPDADENGQVMGSNVELFHELIDMRTIERSFDANMSAMRTYRSMLQNSITNLRG